MYLEVVLVVVVLVFVDREVAGVDLEAVYPLLPEEVLDAVYPVPLLLDDLYPVEELALEDLLVLDELPLLLRALIFLEGKELSLLA